LKETVTKKTQVEAELKDLKESHLQQTAALNALEEDFSELSTKHARVVGQKEALDAELEVAKKELALLERAPVQDNGCGRTISYDPSVPPRVADRTIDLTDERPQSGAKQSGGLP
jgi:hypothetical protein